MRRVLFASSLFLWLTVFTAVDKVYAGNDSQFITLVNPVRISRYTKSSLGSLKSQYAVISKNGLPATWLLTYDIIIDDEIVSFVRNFSASQELGIFLEVTSELSKKADVEYNDTGYWHHATSVFLSGYPQEERIKLIDTVFEEFKKRFGYYPASVGSWWTDSFSLEYMSKKYGVNSNLTVADQFATDGYQVWGQYWSTPFYPSKHHSGIPARNLDVKLDVVNMQWAPRDPLNGYYSSLYSTQDYHLGEVGQPTEYFEKLINLYGKRGKNKFGQIVVGLEGDLESGAYGGEFENQMEVVSKLQDSGKFEISTMKDFSNWYRNTFPDLSPSHLIETDDLLGEDKKAIWYQSPAYRVGLVHDYESGKTKIIDFRSYHSDFQEPYYTSPNSEFTLSIYIPSYFDEISNPEDIWELDFGKLNSLNGDDDEYALTFEKGSIEFRPEKLIIKGGVEVPEILSQSDALVIKKSNDTIEVSPRENWIVPKEGVGVFALTLEATHLLGGKKIRLLLLISAIVIFSASFVLFRKSAGFKLIAVLIVAFPVIAGGNWYKTNTTEYLVSQGEIDALFRLSVLPVGKVLVYDNECLQCEYHTDIKPAIFANKRKYVQEYGKHPIVYNASVFDAKTQDMAREEFEKLNAKYIYLSKYEEYIEKIPFSPGDLNIEKIYGNANAEIWRVKNGT
ncbi:hypothetical protein IID21_01005 [Patescibacteria group bacterium]|nr:hypothetical protein [Patescibacteria group bacterium]